MSARDRARSALSRLVEASATERALISLASLVLAIAVGTVLILVAGRMTACREAAFVLPWRRCGRGNRSVSGISYRMGLHATERETSVPIRYCLRTSPPWV